MTRPSVLLVNPPIYDFTAYDFWLRPYGMLQVAGRLRHACDLAGFDFLVSEQRDSWGRGKFPDEIAAKPEQFRDIPRRFRRFGRPRAEFRQFIEGPRFDAVLIQTGMTYWYPGVVEVIEDLRQAQPGAGLVLGGTYATLCPEHARSLGADLVIEGNDLRRLWRMLEVEPTDSPAYWNGFLRGLGVIKLTDGCPFRCTYCSVPVRAPQFRARATEQCLDEIRQLARLGARQIAFYDDALLFRATDALIPFLAAVERERIGVTFHTPNALNARLVTTEAARQMVRSGFQSFFVGLENSSPAWQAATGGKVRSEEFSQAVAILNEAGAPFTSSYILAGHPDSEVQQVEESMHFAHQLGTRIMLAEFAPIPGTADGERCSKWADLREPLSHNKTAFTIRRLGVDQVNHLKSLCRRLNSAIR